MRQRVSALLVPAALALLLLAAVSASGSETQSRIGYYRFPTIHDQTLVFVAEGDLWKVNIEGGVARRLTTHPGLESYACLSPDGRWVAYQAQYEGPSEAYVMPVEGGLPTRLTYYGRWARPKGWTPEGKVLCATQHFSTLPSTQLVAIDPKTVSETRIPLSQAAEGVYDDSGRSFFFTRFAKQGSYTKRYKGGTAQNLWRFRDGDSEAVPLTADYTGTSRWPMWYEGRVYFVSDRDGTLNIWSMDEDGQNLKQETSHKGWDVKTPSQSGGKIVYQLGADLHLYDIATGDDKRLDITLATDFDQRREHWVDKPFDYLTSTSISPDGDRVVLTARGDLFVVPVENGRTVEATRDESVRYRDGQFMPDGKTLLALSDASGEYEFWTVQANGLGKSKQVTDNATAFREYYVLSPDGKKIAFTDIDAKLWIHNIEDDVTTFVDSAMGWGYQDMSWSPDNRWLAYIKQASNFLERIFIYDTARKTSRVVTSERFRDRSVAWSTDGKWLYFLSNRDMTTIVPNVWTVQQPFPFVDKLTKIYMLPLQKGLRSPFEPDNELTAADKDDGDEEKDDADTTLAVTIDFDGIEGRAIEVPVPSGNYGSLSASESQLLWLSWEVESSGNRSLQTIEIKSKDAKVETLLSGITSYEQSHDGKKMLIRKGQALHVVDISTSAPDLDKGKVDLGNWSFSVNPAVEWRQMFVDAWRMERDYFYDPNMHSVDWPAILEKYLPLVDRITDRHELSDLIGEMVGELSALHTYIWGGDLRKGPEDAQTASLGALLVRDDNLGGYRVDHVYQSDPDEPDKVSPLARPDVNVAAGDVITEVNGQSVLSVPTIGALLRKQAGREVLLTVDPATSQESRQVIVKPITARQADDLRYRDWEYSRRLIVEEESDGDVGYIHMRATSTENYTEWVSTFYSIFNRKGLVLDLRHNGGGNIDSWILTSLLRKPWAYWKSRTGWPYSNMQQAFNGHVVVLCNEWTASDGELLSEGIRRLGIGKLVGTRTWGGEIWLSYRTWLADRGIASAAESGVYGPEGEWLIEGHGVEPDIVVDNLPHETFGGRDAQLEAAIEYLKEQIRLHPVEVPAHPRYPDKSFKEGQ